MQKVFRVTVDISKKIPAPAFEVNTNDLKSVKLEITITNGQSLLDLTDVTPRINIRKPDNEVIFQDCEIVDATAGKVEVILENQAYLVPGTHTAEIACYKGSEITAITGTFSYKSVKGIMNDEAVESKSEFTAIDRKIEEARKLLEDAAESGVGVDEQARQDVLSVKNVLGFTEIFDPPVASNEWVATGDVGQNLNMTVSRFLGLFYDPLVGTHADGYKVTKTSRGKDQSGQFDLWEYDFKPANYTKTILLSSGMHPYELSAHFGLAHFTKHLMATPYMHDGFRYLRENVRIKIIPVINPWGFDRNPKTYGNSRGVNVNRNFDYNGKWASFPVYSANPADPNYNEWNVKGSAPYSEAETRIVRDWVTENANAKFWIDMHTGYGVDPPVENYIYHLSDSPLIPNIYSALDKLEHRIRTKYGKQNPTRRLVIDSDGSIRHNWSQYAMGIPTITIEQTPKNTLWGGTIANNDGHDIAEYEATIAAYTFEFLEVGLISEIKNVNQKTEKIGDNLSKMESEIVRLLARIEALEKGEAPPTNILVSDTFDRADSTTSLGVAETGQSWEAPVFGITGGKAHSTSQTDVTGAALVDIGISDKYRIGSDITFSTYAGLWLNFTSATKTLTARFNNTGLALFSYNDSATATKIGEHLFTPTSGRVYNLKVEVNEKTLSVYLDGTKVIEGAYTGTFNGTKVGLRTSNDKESRFDNFKVEAL